MSSAVPASAPPEAFVFGSKPKRASLYDTFSSFVSDVTSLGHSDSLPKSAEPLREGESSPGIFAALTSLAAYLPASPKAEPVTAVNPTPPQPAGSVTFDFDGDGKADIGRWHASNTQFKIKNLATGLYDIYTLGSASARPAPGDFDGDQRTDAAVFEAGTWTIRRSSDGTTQTISLGASGDVPAAGDFDGDGKTDAAVFRPSTGTWLIRQSSTGNTFTQNWGLSGDIPVQGKYDADNITDMAVYRPSNGTWYVLSSALGIFTQTWGFSTDIPVPADYDGDGKTDFAVYRGSTGTWYVIQSSDGAWLTPGWGNYGDQPVPADYDGDGKADFAIWRPTTGVWHILRSSDSQYSYQTLGVPGDFAINSAYVKQIGGQVFGYDLMKARLSPKNATGGTDLYSRNFSWSTSLVSLPGRAGLDAAFGMSYNSLVWTKSGGDIYFDTNQDNISPGFRFGFPVIEPIYYDAATQKFSYLMVTPSGRRIEFRQTAVSSIYETADSSYLRLTVKGPKKGPNEVEAIAISVTSTDGTQMKYEWKAGAYRCKEIKDRNGNFITIFNDDQGLLRTVTDTLGRTITVEYDSGLYPTAIKQTWQDGVHTYAAFSYRNITINTNFSNLTVNGPANGTVLKVLDKVTFADSSSVRFDYRDNAYGQIYRINNHAANGDWLNSVSVNLDELGASQTDCPRFTNTKSRVKNFNNDLDVTVPVDYLENQPYNLPDGSQRTGTLIQTTAPNGVVNKIYTASTGWAEGLPVITEDWSEGVKKRWTWTDWTQDDTSLSFILNPRVVESRVGDEANIKRTTTEYRIVAGTTNTAEFGLVSSVKVYDTDLSTVIKQVSTDYNLDPAYVSRRIIGLPAKVEAWGRNDLTGLLEYVSKVTYAYDEGDFSQESNQTISGVVQHDTALYGSTFVVGRGNLTSTTRYDVTGQTSAVTSRVRYDIAGSPVAQIDPLERKVAIDYTDNFTTTVANPTFAYPTRLTDPAGNSSTILYRRDIGANVRAQSPAPAGNAVGKITERLFDSVGRLSRETIVNSGAYTRYEYPANGIQSRVYSTITDTNGNGVGDSSDEVLTESWTDGAGRVRRSRSEHPGSTGGWAATLTEYDIPGRVSRQSVPTEVSVSNPSDPNTWTPAGDDATRGWLWTYQKYDWKGRVVRKINTDGTDSPTLNDSDILISYEGCGCAGGQITTVQSELVPRDDQPNQSARRTQKVYEDVLGRTFKTVAMKWDGINAYTTTEQFYNGRDQVLKTKQTDNTSTETPQRFRETTATFDGHGRLKTSHRPEQQNPDGTPASATYNYNPDDSVASVTDARGAVTSYAYNEVRGLLTGVSYSVPAGSTIPVPSPVTFGYDNAGNRTAMTDGLGTTSYNY